MAYRSRYKFASRPRRRISGRIKRRRLRRKAPRRARKMSTRAILNKTSQKKRDHMLSFSNTTASDPFSPTFSLGPAVMSFRAGSTQPSEFVFIWNATDAPPKIPTDNVEVRSMCPFARRNRYLPLALRSASHWKPITLRRGSGDASASLQRMISDNGTQIPQTTSVEHRMEWSD